MKHIFCCSKREAAKFHSDEPWAAISIATFKNEWPVLSEHNRKGLLQLAFGDITPLYGGIENEKLFTPDDARTILDFVEQVRELVEVLMVHCEAGVSRSPAIACALSQSYLGEDGNFFFSHYMPNSHTYKTLLKVALERGLSVNKSGIPYSVLMSYLNDETGENEENRPI